MRVKTLCFFITQQGIKLLYTDILVTLSAREVAALENSNKILLALCVLFFLLITVIGISKYLKVRLTNIRYAKMELLRSESAGEKAYWKKKLSVYRLCLIPGISVKRAKKLLKIFYRPQRAKEKPRDDIFVMLTPFLIGIAVCGVCLAGSSYAWFTASVGSGATNITAANYDVEVILTCEGDSVMQTDGVYKLEAGKTYDLKLKPDGTAKFGYCRLVFGEGESAVTAITDQIPTETYKNDSFRLTLKINEAVDLKVIHEWGTSASSEQKLQNGSVYTFGEKQSTSTPSPEETPDEDTAPNENEEVPEPVEEGTEPSEPEITEEPAENTENTENETAPSN